LVHSVQRITITANEDESEERTRLACKRQSGSDRWRPVPSRTFLDYEHE